MSYKLILENEFYDKPMLSEADRLRGMMNRLGIFSDVQTKPRPSAEAASLRIRDLYEQVSDLPLSGCSRKLSSKRQILVSRSKELLTGLVSVGLINRPEQQDVTYYYQPTANGEIDYSALINPYDDKRMILKTAEEVGLYQAEMALNLALQVSRIGDLRAKLHPVKD